MRVPVKSRLMGSAMRRRGMNGMLYQWSWAWTFDDNVYTQSYDFSTSPKSTILELSLDNYSVIGDEPEAELAFTHVEWLDSDGVTRHMDFPDPDYFVAVPALSVNGLTYAVWLARIKNCAAKWTMNAYFWDHVY
jgi:hypothetical protein